jgi:enoyl-CoA hydratase
MRHLPQGIVRRMFFTARSLPSDEALQFGLIDSVYDSERLVDAAMARARDIAAHSPLALRLGKAALNDSEPLPVKDGYAAEQEYTLRLARSADSREALAARREKRAPRYSGQ